MIIFIYEVVFNVQRILLFIFLTEFLSKTTFIKNYMWSS